MQDPEKLCGPLGYRFRDPELLKEALTHRSVGNRNNERLEFLGDGALNFVIASELFQRYPNAAEGELSRLRASLVKGETLAQLANELHLGDFLFLGSGELKSGGYRRASILADALEAVFGAVYLDGGFLPCRDLICRIYGPSLENLPDVAELKDPKTRLQELLQSRQMPLPQYEVIEVTGEAHKQTFTVVCRVAGFPESEGSARSRRKAEQQAAMNALVLLRDV